MSDLIEQVAGPRTPEAARGASRARYLAPALFFAAAAVLLLLSIGKPYWLLTLHAPQYPKGLHVQAFLTRLEGDVREIDGLNHYIGMRPLDEAASFEKSVAVMGVVVTVLLVVAAIFIHSRWAALIALPAVLFPLIFLVDLQFWLASFGTNLDPSAPLSSSIKPFVPPVIGEGHVGQFSTTSSIGPGLWLAIVASVVTVVGLILHRRAWKPLVDATQADAAPPIAAGTEASG